MKKTVGNHVVKDHLKVYSRRRYLCHILALECLGPRHKHPKPFPALTTWMCHTASHPLWSRLLSPMFPNPVSESSQLQSPPIWLIDLVSLLGQALTQKLVQLSSLHPQPLTPVPTKTGKSTFLTLTPSSTKILVQFKSRGIAELQKKTRDNQKICTNMCKYANIHTFSSLSSSYSFTMSSEIFKN